MEPPHEAMRLGCAGTAYAPSTTNRTADTADQTVQERIEPLLHPMSNCQPLRGPPSQCPFSGGHPSASRKHAPLHQREEAKGNGNREYVTTKDEPLTLPREAYLRSQGKKNLVFSK